MISLILVLLGAVVFLRLSKFYQFVVLSMSALLPFSLGNFRSIPDLLIVEWLTIITFVMLLNELISVRSLNKEFEKISFKGAEIYIFALGILVIWSVVGFIRNEIIASVPVTGYNTGSKRIYFDIFNNVLLFFTTIIFVAVHYDEIDFEKFFGIILFLSIIIGFVRIFSYFMGFNVPFLAGTFKYDPEAMSQYGGVAYRFGGMTDVVAIGIPALFSLYALKGKFNFIALLILFLFLFLSGGRTVMIGVILAIVVFSILLLPKNLIYFILGGAALFLVLILFAPQSVLEGQIRRLSTFNSGHFMGQDIMRGMAWLSYYKNFLAHPIFGKGIGGSSIFIYTRYPQVETWLEQAQFSGGHGSYLSLLGLYGIGGLIYFLIMLGGGIILSFKKIRANLERNINYVAIGLFCFMLLMIKSVDFLTSDNGLSIPIMFYTVGLIVSLTVLENRRRRE